MGMLYQRGKAGIWWIKFYRAGKPFYESSRSTRKRDAERLLQSREGSVADGRFTGLRVERLRFEEMAADLLTEQGVNGRRSLAWTARKVRTLAVHFAGRRAMDITTPAIRHYIETRQAEGAAAASINRELATLKRMFTLAIQAGKLYHRPHIPLLREDNVRTGFLGEIEYLALREALPAPINHMLDFAYLYGWRKAEVMELTWDRVDLLAGTVRLDPGTTKNGQGRTVVLTEALREMLANLHKEARAVAERTRRPVPWVFHRDGHPIKDFRGAWKAACVQVGLPNLLFHDLRRTAARNLVRAGVSERVAMSITGHKTRSIFDRYNIVSEGDLREAAKRLEGAVQHPRRVTENVTVLALLDPARPYSSQERVDGCPAQPGVTA